MWIDLIKEVVANAVSLFLAPSSSDSSKEETRTALDSEPTESPSVIEGIAILVGMLVIVVGFIILAFVA